MKLCSLLLGTSCSGQEGDSGSDGDPAGAEEVSQQNCHKDAAMWAPVHTE